MSLRQNPTAISGPASALPGTLPSSSLARFTNVSKSFQRPDGGILEVLKGVSLEIAEGEIVTMLGPSGCGKSTLLNMLAGIFPPNSGEVFYRDRPVREINTRTGYMTQNDHLLPWRTVAHNVRAPLEIRGMPRAQANKRVEELLDLVNLTGFGGAYPSQISGGMRKRVVLARLLAYDPDTLLLDEPFVALDAQLRLAMQMQLRHLSKTLGKTVMFVTHDVDEAVALGDRCVVFSARPGTVREIVDINLGTSRDLLRLRGQPAYAELCAKLWNRMALSEGGIS